MATKVFTFSGVLWTDRHNPYIIPQQYASLYGNVTPFVSAAMARYNPDAVKLLSPDFKMFEHRAGWRYQKLTVNAANPATWKNTGANGVGVPNDGIDDLIVDTATGITVDASLLGHRLEVWDSTGTTYKGVVLVTVVDSTTQIHVKSVGNPESATEAVPELADNDVLYVLDTAHGEEVEAPEASSDELEVVWNSAQLHRSTLEIGHTLKQAALRGEQNELARLRNEKGNEHKIKMARGFYWGHRPGGIGGTAWGADSTGSTSDTTFVNHITDVNSKTVRTSMGIYSALRRYGRRSGDQQNFFSFAMGAFTYNDWVDMTDKWYQYNPTGEMKEVYGGPGFCNQLYKIGAEGLLTKNNGTRMNIDLYKPEQSAMGLVFRILVTPRGPVRLIEDQLLRGTPYNNWGLCLTPSQCNLVKYEQDTYTPNIKQDNNPRVQKDEMTTFSGIKMGIMEAHSAIQLT